MSKISVLDVKFDNYSMREFQNLFLSRMNNKQSTFIVTANPEIVMAAKDNPDFKELVNGADFLTADGIGIIKGANILKTPMKERVTGYDLFSWFIEIAEKRSSKIFFVGAKPEVIAKVAQKVAEKYPHIQVVGAKDGYFKEDLQTVATEIEAVEPDMVFAALGYPRQEELINILRQDNLPAMMMGVGGSFDVFSGTVKRAPMIFQKAHLEWFYRLLTNPTRFKRMLVLPKFIGEVKKSRKKN